MTAPGPKNPMSKDMRAYLKTRYPNKDLDKLWAESTAMRRHGWQKNLKVWLRLKKIPGIEKLGKINPGDGAYNEKVRLLKQFNELYQKATALFVCSYFCSVVHIITHRTQQLFNFFFEQFL